jgi:DNA-binding MarR family transcriptional regulator
MTPEEIDSCLFSFLQTSYHFEKQEQRHFNLSWQEIYLLQLLKRSEFWQISQLGKKLELKKFQISRLVSRLEALGLVQRLDQAGDRRNVYVAIQEAGNKLLQDIEIYHRELFRLCESRGGPGIEHLATLHHAIHQFAAMVGIQLEE